MPPRHVGVHGCFPEPWHSSAARTGASESQIPKMLPGPSRAVLSPGASAAPEVGANPKQGLVLLGTVRVPAVLRDPVTRGWAGSRAPEPPSAPTAAPQGASAASPAPHRRKDAEFGQCLNPDPSARTERGIPLRPKSRFITTDRANRAAPGGCPSAGSGVSCILQGSAQLGWGKAVLFLGAGRAPGPEAAAAQLTPALAGLRQPRHILSLPAPGRPQGSRVTLPVARPRWPPPLTPQDNRLG